MYCNNVLRDSLRDPYNPYSLMIVPHSQRQEDNYYTISSKGVTHFVNGEAGEFVCACVCDCVCAKCRPSSSGLWVFVEFYGHCTLTPTCDRVYAARAVDQGV